MYLMIKDASLFSPAQAALWASEYLGKRVTSNNILYLLNYGKIANYADSTQENLVNINELQNYYDTNIKAKSHLDSPLSFAKYKEAETTKHIHRIHPYKGKFIPQLVEYFLDLHKDSIKQDVCFQRGDIVLDIFCGSGTTLSVANELGMNAIGIDISLFNAMLSNAKIKKYDLIALKQEISRLTKALQDYTQGQNIIEFDRILSQKLSEFNQSYFPNKDFKRKVVLKEIDEKRYGEAKEKEFLRIYEDLIKRFHIIISTKLQGNFFEKWYIESIKNEILFLKSEITKAPTDLQDILYIILSRTARSCRATTHLDLATLITPINKPYYCKKHGRICKPLFSIAKWWKSYTIDTLKRLDEFSHLRSDTKQICLNADSTNVDIVAKIAEIDKEFAEKIKTQKIAGIFSSPPYVGLIDYHEQHAYAYDILDLARNDNLEIGKKSLGQSKNAQENYAKSIAQSLLNAKPFLKKDYDVFLVANDRFNLYPQIAHLAKMQIINRYERPVLNRSEKDTNAYSESIFHLRESHANHKN